MDTMRDGDRYGLWTVVDSSREADYKVKCVCDCGTERRVLRHKLTAGQSKSCGCVRDEARNERVANLARGVRWPQLVTEKATVVEPGAKFGRWTVQDDPYTVVGSPKRVAACRCDCGSQRIIRSDHLMSGRTKSCGCLRRDGARARSARAS